MASDPTSILKSGAGSLHDTPLPELLRALLVTRRTCTLELKHQALEKQIYFEDGAPIACSSNVAQESLGRYLVERNVLSETDFLQLLAEAASRGARLEDLLLEKKVCDEQQLAKHLQGNLGRKILDGFRWVDARYRLMGTGQLPDAAQRMNPLQLIYTGVCTILPFERISSSFPFYDLQRFARVHAPPHAWSELKLGPKDARLPDVLLARPTRDELCAALEYTPEEATRRLYALAVLGLVDFAEQVPVEPPAATPEGVDGAVPHSAAPGETPAAAPVQPKATVPPPGNSEVADHVPGPEATLAAAAEDLAALKRAQKRGRGLPLTLAGGAVLGAVLLALFLLRPKSTAPVAPARTATAAAQPSRPRRTPPPALELPALPTEGTVVPPGPRGLALSASGVRFPLPQAKGTRHPLVARGAQALAKGRAAEASASFLKASKAAPKDPDARYGMALAAYELRRDAEARGHVAAALQLAPKHAGAHLLAGYLAQLAGDPETARTHYRRYVDLLPQAPDAADVAAIAAQLDPAP